MAVILFFATLHVCQHEKPEYFKAKGFFLDF
jgi:hypothetical protein